MAKQLAASLTIGCLLASPLAAAAQAPSEGAPEAAQRAKVPEPCPDEKSYRELAGHLFLPSHLMGDPFSYTAVGLSWGLGGGQATGPTLNLGPPPSLDFQNTKSYPYTGLGLGLVLNVRFLEYLSMYATLDTQAYLGTSGSSFLVVGTNAQIGAAFGLKGSLPIGEHVRLAASAGIDYGPVYTALIAEGLIDAIQTGRIDADQFLQANTALTWVAAVAAAWAPFPFLGISGTARFLFPTGSGNVQYASNGVALTAMADLDLLPLVHWLPLGVNAVYSLLTPLGGELATTTDFGLGVYYTGRKALAVGVEVDFRHGHVNSGPVSQSTLAWLNLRYYWGPSAF